MFDYILLPAQLIVGLFFAVTGYRKLFNPAVHAQVFGLFARLRVPVPARWAVVLGEFLGGLGLLFGTLSWWAALGLVPIMLGAYVMDTLPGIRAKHPDGITGWVSKLICNPEALLLLFLFTFIVEGL